MSQPTLSIVVPSYNGRSLLGVCLPSIARCLPRDLAIEVIVVDDGSTDGTVDWVRSAHPEVKVVALVKNRGFVGAANAGVAEATGEFIQLLNNDTEVTPGWVEAGLAPFSDPRVGSVAPLVLVRSDRTRVDSAGDSYAFFGWPCKRGHGESAIDWSDREHEEVFGASGSSAFYRASALQLTGAYDPSFGSYYEDVDLAFRLRWAGYRCIFAPACRVLHEVSASYDHGKSALQRRMARNAEYLYWTNLPRTTLVATFLPHLAFIAFQALWRALRGRGGPFLLGKLDAIRGMAHVKRGRRHRQQLRRSAIGRPHFPMPISLVRDARNHLARPAESFARLRG